MSGRRILDALALLNTSRKIATKHFDLRFSQIQSYGQSSSVVKALRKRALPALATAVSRFASSQSPSKPPKQGIQQDHFYTRTEPNGEDQGHSSGELDVTQAKAGRSSLPDGTIPPRGSPIGEETGDGMTFGKRAAGETPQHPVEGKGAENLHVKSSNRSTIPDPAASSSLSPDEARKLQRQHEDQIPARTAESSATNDSKEFNVEQEQDVFYQPPDSVTPVLSALPRVRVPKTENDVQEGNSHIAPGINADVYYSGSKHEDGREEEPSEEQLTQLFHNPKHAKLLGTKSRYVPGGVTPRRFHTMSASLQKRSDTDAESIKKLAADMARDAQKSDVSAGLSLQWTEPF
jgi:aarF domain-containing kinase